MKRKEFRDLLASCFCLTDFEGGRVHIGPIYGRTWARKNSSFDNSSVYKRGQADGSSVKTNYRRSSSVQTNLLA